MNQTGIKPADQRKYKKAFEKWATDGGLLIDDIKDLFWSLKGKLKLDPTADELRLLIKSMGVEEEQQQEKDATVSLEQFMQGVAAREGIVGK